MKSELLLLQHVLEDIQRRCCTSTARDFIRVTRRVEREGIEFLSIVLPRFGKDFESCLDEGAVPSRRIAPTLFTGFARAGALPKLFSGLLGQIFDPASGVLLDEPSVESIQAIRQICGLFAKTEAKANPEREAAAFRRFVECERDIVRWDKGVEHHLTPKEARTSKIVFHTLFGDVCRQIENNLVAGTLVPRHGPGSTADRLLGNQKWTLPTWTRRLEEVFGAADYLIPNYRHWECLESVDFLEPGDEPPVRVISVPKTVQTPRIIAIEPTHMQFMQQALATVLVKLLQRPDNLCSHFLGFRDQVPNQIMAQSGSSTGDLATLDLSDASDRVPNTLVQFLFSDWPLLSEAIQACRSRTADVPGHGVIPLSKFASMGSALTFPIEAMVFLTAVFSGFSVSHNTRLVRESDFRRFIGQVRVYGDDIVVPTDYVLGATGMIESFNGKVNPSKSFWTGKFRESCGKEYYDGEDVTIVRIRRELPTSHLDAESAISTVSTRNQFYWHGYWSTASFLDHRLLKVFKGSYPVVGVDSPILGRESVFEPMAELIHPDLHIPLVKGYRQVSKIPSNHIDGLAALRKSLITDRETPIEDERHLERSGRPSSVNIKKGFGPAV